MFRFWWPGWYRNKSREFLEDRCDRKPFATAFIIISSAFFIVSATRWVIGRPFDWPLLLLATVVMAAGAIWFRIAYLSQEELKRRNEEEKLREEELDCLDCRDRVKIGI